MWQRTDEDDRKAGEIAADFADIAKVVCEALVSGCMELLGKMFEDLEKAFSGELDGTNNLSFSDTLDCMNPYEPPDNFIADIDADFAPPQSADFPHL